MIQESLYEYLDVILNFNRDLKNPNSGFTVLTNIFLNNSKLCDSIPADLGNDIIRAVRMRMNTKEFSGTLLNPLMALIICDNQPIRRNQRIVMNALWEDQNHKLLILFNAQGVGTPEMLKKLMSKASKDVFGAVTGPLGYYVALLHLLSACCRGKATVEEVKCKSLFTFRELVSTICDVDTVWLVKLPLLTLLYDSYLDSDLHGEGVETMQNDMPALLNECLRILEDSTIIEFFNNDNNGGNAAASDGGKEPSKEEVAAKSSWAQAEPQQVQQMFNGILDYIVCGIAAIVGQELYIHAGTSN